jgi:hypothetical protein
LNIAADEEATWQWNRMSEPVCNVQIIGEAQVRVKDIAITRDSQWWILQTAGSIPIQQYYQERYYHFRQELPFSPRVTIFAKSYHIRQELPFSPRVTIFANIQAPMNHTLKSRLWTGITDGAREGRKNLLLSSRMRREISSL